MTDLRRWAYLLLMVASVATVTARIAHVELVYEPSLNRNEGEPWSTAHPRIWPKERPKSMPTFSSNDRSRWCTIRNLVDEGKWDIGERTYPDPNQPETHKDEGIVFKNGWQSIDLVLNPDTHKFYSSKPPLLTFLAAGEYWLLSHVLDWRIDDKPNHVVKTILLTFDLLPLIVYLVLLQRLLERHATTDLGRLFVFTGACFGTFLTTFATTLNNHTLAACATLVAIYPFLNQEPAAMPRWSWLPPLPSTGAVLLSGIMAGLTTCLELPALAFAAILLSVVCLRSPLRGLLFLLAAALPIVLEIVLNHQALGIWEPVYFKFGTEWYEYPGSHWKLAPGQIKNGIDWAWQHESRSAYVFHTLIGHHGLFSLTPLWILSFMGMFAVTFGYLFKRKVKPASYFLFPLTLVVSLVVIGFYLLIVGTRNHNYGGWTSGLRWLFWLTPLWLLTMLPAADWLAGRRWGRILALACLAVSIFSASYPVWNPWRHPWLYDLLESQGWIQY
ncbi:MAG TPA: hypothetical protein VGZ47_20000 [Gemmataceae bacterium]|jgi:hypothetical protein|nr:hypothetical protein [Gemmataceae bacterium]